MIPKIQTVAQLPVAAAAQGLVIDRFEQPENQVMVDWEVAGTNLRTALLFLVDGTGAGTPVPMVLSQAAAGGAWDSSNANAESPPQTLGQLLVRLRDLIIDHAGPELSASHIARWEIETLRVFNGLWPDVEVSSPPPYQVPVDVQPVLPGNAADCVVVGRTELAQLREELDALFDSASTDGCEEPYFVGDITHLRRLRDRFTALASRTVMESIRLVDAEDEANGPLMVVLPLRMSGQEAAAAMDAAIHAANAETSAGEAPGVSYHKALVAKLEASGLHVEFGIEQLGSKQWDAKTIEPEPPTDDPNWVDVTFSHDADSDEEWDEVVVGTLVSGEQVRYRRGPDIGAYAVAMHYKHPNAAKYGYPMRGGDEAEARQFVFKALEIACARDFAITMEDTGDDSIDSWTVRARVNRDFLEPVEQPRQHPVQGRPS